MLLTELDHEGPAPVPIAGMLQKRTKVLKAWQSRFFVVRSHYLLVRDASRALSRCVNLLLLRVLFSRKCYSHALARSTPVLNLSSPRTTAASICWAPRRTSRSIVRTAR